MLVDQWHAFGTVSQQTDCFNNLCVYRSRSQHSNSQDRAARMHITCAALSKFPHFFSRPTDLHPQIPPVKVTTSIRSCATIFRLQLFFAIDIDVYTGRSRRSRSGRSTDRKTQITGNTHGCRDFSCTCSCCINMYSVDVIHK